MGDRYIDIHVIIIRPSLFEIRKNRNKGRPKCVYMETHLKVRKYEWLPSVRFPGQMTWTRTQF